MIRKKILTPTSLAKLLKKRGSKKVVFTNGCFDLLHPGHVTYLEKARAKGDVLVVALNTDQSVSKIKGPTRPINSLKDRQTVIAALESVSYVTHFGEDTPLKLILQLHPDILVKGGDWKPSQIVGSQEVASWGGRTYSISFVEGKSTTNIIKKMTKS